MITFRKIALASGLCAMGAIGAGTALAQSTDAFHTIQVFPVVVDTNSFAQRFTFRNPNSAILNMAVRYYAADGTSGPTQNCPNQLIAANSDKTFASLRALCPGLTAGVSQFGFLYTYEVNSANMPYSGFSRVANPQGNGFSVEAFPAHTFTSATSSIAGIRRIAATVLNPTFQTNCFVGNMNEITASGVLTGEVWVRVYNSAGVQIGSTLQVPVQPGRMVRLLDVFAAVGAPAGDYNDARVTFTEQGGGEPGHIALCTVQDNTSFGADFRIAKQESGGGGEFASVGAQDDHVSRSSRMFQDARWTTDSLGTTARRQWELPAVTTSHNSHVFYFRHPDWVACRIINPATGVEALDSYGIEMRLLSPTGTVIAGGGDETSFGETYLGDKNETNSGANARYVMEVEWNGSNSAATKPYDIECESGSGHTGGDIIRYNATIDTF